ncbi:hypothetical protein ADK34_20705, partial [Streptomyces viridochromogenes]
KLATGQDAGHVTWHMVTSGLAFGTAGGARAAAQKVTPLKVNPVKVPRAFNNKFVQVKTGFTPPGGGGNPSVGGGQPVSGGVPRDGGAPRQTVVSPELPATGQGGGGGEPPVGLREAGTPQTVVAPGDTPVGRSADALSVTSRASSADSTTTLSDPGTGTGAGTG